MLFLSDVLGDCPPDKMGADDFARLLRDLLGTDSISIDDLARSFDLANRDADLARASWIHHFAKDHAKR